jgi:LemA protein
MRGKTMKKIFLLAFVLFAAFGFSGCSYNALTAQQQGVRGKWANVESALQRRADLIPNLVKTAQMAGVQEQEVFGQIADARSRLLNATQAAPQGADGDKTPEQKQRFSKPTTALAEQSDDFSACRKIIRFCARTKHL